MEHYFYRYFYSFKRSSKLLALAWLGVMLFFNLNAQVNTGGSATTSDHNKQVIGYLTNWDAWKQSNAGVPGQGALTHLNIDYSKYTILNYSFFGVARDGSLHSGDLRNKDIYQTGQTQEPGDLFFVDPFSSWDLHILFGEIENAFHINADIKTRAEAQGFVVELDAQTWSHPGWRVTDQPLPLPLHKEGGAPGLLELAHQNGVKVAAALGGWSMSKHFPEMAADPVKRANFITDCKRLIDLGFDGIDLDWEFPGPFSGMNFTGTSADFGNFVTLINELRTEIGADKLVTAVFSTNPNHIQQWPWSQLGTLDYMTFFTYDYNGGWSNKAGHNAPLNDYPGAEFSEFNWQSAFNNLQTQGVDMSKVCFGLPLYGRGVVTDGTASLNAPTLKRSETVQPDGPITTSADFTNWPKDVYDGTPTAFFVEQSKANGWTEHWDSDAMVPYLTKGNFFLSYDNVQSIEEKAKFINDNNLAGAIVWTVYGDLEFGGTATSFGSKLKRWSNVGSPLINKANEVFASGGSGNTNQNPSVSITAPSPGAAFTEGDNVTISANAADTDGIISQVEFFVGTTSLGVDATSPYSIDWTSAGVGNHSLTARATDNDNGSTTSIAISITINSSGGGTNQNPIVALTSPVGGAIFSVGDVISVNANASDTDGTVAQVEFLANGTSLGTDTASPFVFDWNGAAVGNYDITAIATDNENATSTSTAVSIVVESLGGGDTCAGVAQWSASATYNAGDEVQFNGFRYQANWWTQDNPETHNGETGSGQPWALIGPCTGTTNQAPSVNITSPSSGAVFTDGDVITISANATDTDGSVSQVEFFANGISLGVDSSSPYTMDWASAAVGNHTITASATDNENATSTSLDVSITVNSGGGNTNDAPTVVITSPTGGASFDEGNPVTISANASDTDGSVIQVEFFANGSSLGIDSTSPFSITWSNTTVGNHDLTAVATDNENATSTSVALPITVNSVGGGDCVGVPVWSSGNTYVDGNQVQLNGNKYEANWWTQANPESNNGAIGSGQPWTLIGPCSGGNSNQSPSINVTGPSDGASFILGDNITITASASDTDGSITQVEFFANGSSLGIDTTSPYSLDWANGTVGSHSITATAMDNENASTTSASVVIAITNPNANQLPSVSLTAPVSGNTFIVGSSIVLTATASDADGTIALVEFFDGATKIGDDATLPYEFTWSSGSLGSHTLTARAIDNENGQTTSTAVNVSITSDGNPPGGGLAQHIMVGYWHNFNNGAAVLELGQVSTDWDVVNVAFAEPATFGGADMAFFPSSDVTSDAQFRQDIGLLHNRGQKVLISIGGANGRIELLTAQDAQIFATAMINLIEDYGFDGMDIDLEGSSLALSTGDNDFQNPTSPKIVNFIAGTQLILDHFSSDFILSAAPETAFVQGGNSVYAGSFGAYLPVLYNFRNRLNYIHVQDYNSGCMLGLDGVCYSQGTADFHVAMTEMLLQGFSVAGHSVSFPAFRPDQVAFGIPASPQAAGGGYTSPADVQKSLDYLVKGIPFGGNYTMVNSNGYPLMRGLMTWSINWDVFFNQEFSSNHRPYLDALLSGSGARTSESAHEQFLVEDKKIVGLMAYPNPMDNLIHSVFDLAGESRVILTLFNQQGVSIDILADKVMNKGTHELQWDMSMYPRGLYFLQLKTNLGTETMKVFKE